MVTSFARAVEATIHKMDNDPRSTDAIMAAVASFVSDGYPLETEKQDLLDVFDLLLHS
jgi:hypothetical protein